MKATKLQQPPDGGSLRRRVRRFFRREKGVCYECRFYSEDEEAKIRLNVNFRVGGCSKGMVLSSGVVRGHDTCGLWKANLPLLHGGPAK